MSANKGNALCLFQVAESSPIKTLTQLCPSLSLTACHSVPHSLLEKICNIMQTVCFKIMEDCPEHDLLSLPHIRATASIQFVRPISSCEETKRAREAKYEGDRQYTRAREISSISYINDHLRGNVHV